MALLQVSQLLFMDCPLCNGKPGRQREVPALVRLMLCEEVEAIDAFCLLTEKEIVRLTNEV